MQAVILQFQKCRVIKHEINNLRFPGQYFDEESGLHYNYFRDYNPNLGRYMQSDPIGLNGGVNTYAYAIQNPLFWIDTDGLRRRSSTRANQLLNPPSLGETVNSNRRDPFFSVREAERVKQEYLNRMKPRDRDQMRNDSQSSSSQNNPTNQTMQNNSPDHRIAEPVSSEFDQFSPPDEEMPVMPPPPEEEFECGPNFGEPNASG